MSNHQSNKSQSQLEEGHKHVHDHEQGSEDPFSNPSKFFIWKYAFRNYIRRRTYYKELLKVVHLRGSEFVLDFGSGTGTLAKKLVSKLTNGQLYCLDVSSKLLDYTKNQLKNRSNVTFLLGDLKNQALPVKSFDLIISTWVLHHLDKDTLTQTIKEFSSILKESGKIYIIEFPEQYEHNHHIHSSLKLSDILELFFQSNFSHKVLFSKKGGILYEFSK